MDEDRIFPVMCSGRTRRNGLNLVFRKYHTNIQNFFTIRVMDRNKLPRVCGLSFYRDIQNTCGCLPVCSTVGNLFKQEDWTQ